MCDFSFFACTPVQRTGESTLSGRGLQMGVSGWYTLFTP
jgi:hypothetical protein